MMSIGYTYTPGNSSFNTSGYYNTYTPIPLILLDFYVAPIVLRTIDGASYTQEELEKLESVYLNNYLNE